MPLADARETGANAVIPRNGLCPREHRAACERTHRTKTHRRTRGGRKNDACFGRVCQDRPLASPLPFPARDGPCDDLTDRRTRREVYAEAFRSSVAGDRDHEARHRGWKRRLNWTMAKRSEYDGSTWYAGSTDTSRTANGARCFGIWFVNATVTSSYSDDRAAGPDRLSEAELRSVFERCCARGSIE